MLEAGGYNLLLAATNTSTLMDVETLWGVTLKTARLNGITQRWADTGGDGRPVVIFMHGWPESWFSWRHQLKAVSAAGYRGIAPDMRGFGGTHAPSHFADYSVFAIAADMHALMQHLGVVFVALVGHDHGANVGWKLALLHPDTFRCYCALSVPYAGRPRQPPIDSLRAKFGDEREPASDPQFNYQLHHQLADAAAHYNRDHRGALLTLLQGPEGDKQLPPVQSTKMFVKGIAEPIWRRLPVVASPPPWMAQEDFDYLLSTFAERGFEGGLNWYRVMDHDWHATPHLDGAKLAQPIAFIGGLNDTITKWFGGPDHVRSTLKAVCAQEPAVHFLDASHWIQQEMHAEVSKIILSFLDIHHFRFADSKSMSSKL